ncbi:MAG TPA: hypothetical protein ENH87_17265 [Pricia antarctica]|uniref:Uncharacterized protein n=2 Tax=root TaxID=1 RepID=A0A831QT38_9FLAO|nr:hypothetical protein [Pricia antarctica]
MKNLNYSSITKNLMLIAGMLIITMANAQQTTGDIANDSVAVPGVTALGGSIRVIDNRGTIKYLQSKNGITMLSNTTNDVTTTTWQLGGVLTDSTFIDVDGFAFGLDGIDLINTETASTDATTKSDRGEGTGYTILVRDEETGAIKKLLSSDLNLIRSGQERFTATAGQVAYDLTSGTLLPTFSQVWVYRNGAKLISNLDYTIAGSEVTLAPSVDWAVYAGDVIEVQFIR